MDKLTQLNYHVDVLFLYSQQLEEQMGVLVGRIINRTDKIKKLLEEIETDQREGEDA